MYRTATPADLEMLLSVRQHDAVAIVDAARFTAEFDLHRYRFEWSWLHEENGELLSRALWWGPADSEHPLTLDCLWVSPAVPDPSSEAGALVRTAHRALATAGADPLPDLILTVPPAWKSDPSAVAAVDWRTAAVASAGLTETIERLSYAWTATAPPAPEGLSVETDAPNGSLSEPAVAPATPAYGAPHLPARSSRLSFAAGTDDDFLRLFAGVAVDSLDLLTLRNLADMGADAQAADDLDFYLSLPGDRSLWRIAFDADEREVGFIIPSRSAYDASVSYLGVLPEARGHGYVDDLLAEITHLHAETGAPRITGTTDTTNAPMAAAFLRAGYEITQARVVVGPRVAAAPTVPGL